MQRQGWLKREIPAAQQKRLLTSSATALYFLCGIAGLIHRGKTGDIGRDMTAMLRSLKHRGPDSTGFALYHEPKDGEFRLRFYVGEGDAAAYKEVDAHRLAEVAKPGGGEHRPSMGQDMVKGRRTEIEFLNGLIVEKGKEVGIPTPANAALTDIVKRVERGEIPADPRNLIDLRLN